MKTISVEDFITFNNTKYRSVAFGVAKYCKLEENVPKTGTAT